MITEQRLNFIKLIEAEKSLESRFINLKSINGTGGSGFFSIVFTAYDQKTKKEVALKFYDPSKSDDTDRLKRFEREAKILNLLKKEELVIDIVGEGLRYLEKVFIDPGTGIEFPQNYQYIAMDLADSNLADHIYSENGDDARINLYIFREILKAVFRLHNRKICHRDLKPDNFLNKNGKILLSDLGTSKAMNNEMYNIRDEYFTPVGHRDYLIRCN